MYANGETEELDLEAGSSGNMVPKRKSKRRGTGNED